MDFRELVNKTTKFVCCQCGQEVTNVGTIEFEDGYHCYCHNCGEYLCDVTRETEKVVTRLPVDLEDSEESSMDSENRNMKKEIKLLHKQYEIAKELDFIENPLAYALYHTWRIFDEQYAKKKVDSNKADQVN